METENQKPLKDAFREALKKMLPTSIGTCERHNMPAYNLCPSLPYAIYARYEDLRQSMYCEVCEKEIEEEAERRNIEGAKAAKEKEVSETRERIISGSFMSIPKRFQPASLEDFGNNFNYSLEESILIYGKCGTGKTHLSVAMAKKVFLRINESEKRVFPKGSFVNFQEFTIAIKSSFKEESKSMREMIIKQCDDFRIFDDICASKPTETAIEALYCIVNARYEEMIPTIYTTNLTLAEISSAYGDRIASRLADCRRIELTGEDRRINKIGNNILNNNKPHEAKIKIPNKPIPGPLF